MEEEFYPQENDFITVFEKDLKLSEENEVKEDEEDDLEIPAFLRRQKN